MSRGLGARNFLSRNLFANKKNEWTFFFLVDIFFFEFTFFFEIFEVCVRQKYFLPLRKKNELTFFFLSSHFFLRFLRCAYARYFFCLCEKKMS